MGEILKEDIKDVIVDTPLGKKKVDSEGSPI
ncbi:MAG: hypothetical protein PWP57_207 [Candidatus Atribacteria bacterium]|nr:hypothetical protein [Candidatus Atribacteria bacterium]